MPVDLTDKPKDTKTGLPVVEAPIKGTNNISIPEDVSNRSFVDDFEVEQLPAQEVEPSIKKEGKKQEAPEKEDKVEETEPEKKESAKEEVIDEKPKAKSIFDSVLKKPGQKVEDKKAGEEKPIGLQKTTRDYTGMSPEEAKAFKGMSNEGYEYATRIRKENGELSKLKDTLYLQHDRAYTLSSEYNELTTTARMASFEERYWNEQLINMDAGKDLVPLTGYDPRTNQPIYSQPLKPTKDLEEKVRQAMYEASNASRAIKSKLIEYPTQYKTRMQQDIQNIEAYRKQQFAWAGDESMLDHTIDIGGQDKSLKQIRQDVSNMIPAYLRSSPLAPLIQDLVIAVRIQKAQLSQYESSQQVNKVKEEEQELVEPSSKDKAQPKGKGEKVHGMVNFEIDPSIV